MPITPGVALPVVDEPVTTSPIIEAIAAAAADVAEVMPALDGKGGKRKGNNG